jgi:hypothetical protein
MTGCPAVVVWQTTGFLTEIMVIQSVHVADARKICLFEPNTSIMNEKWRPLCSNNVRRHPCGDPSSLDSSSNDPFVRNHTERLTTVSEQALRDIPGRNRVNVDFSVLFGFYQNPALAQKPNNMQLSITCMNMGGHPIAPHFLARL